MSDWLLDVGSGRSRGRITDRVGSGVTSEAVLPGRIQRWTTRAVELAPPYADSDAAATLPCDQQPRVDPLSPPAPNEQEDG